MIYGLVWRLKKLAILSLLLGGTAAEQPQEIRPGDADIDGTRVQPGVWQIRYVRSVDGREQEIGVMRHRLDVIQQDGETLLRSVTRFGGPRGDGVDTAIAVRNTLHPRVHRAVHPTTTLSLDFKDGWVAGRSSEKDKAPVEKRAKLPAPVFDANMFEVVLGALPLREGLHVRIPTYVFEREDPLWFEARVLGLENVTVEGVSTPAWAVLVKTERGDGTFYIDRESRQMVNALFRSPDGSELRMIRTAGDQSGS